MRIPSRIPPDFASLMLMPWAISGAGGDVGKRVAVLVDVDGDRRPLPQHLPAFVTLGQRLLAVLDPELGELWQSVERLVERPPLVHVDLQRQGRDRADGADALDVEAVGTAELQLEPAEPSGDAAPPGAPCRRGRRATPSRTSAGRCAGDRAGARWRHRAAFPADRAAHRRDRLSRPARPGSRRAGRRSPPARTGRHRRGARAPRRTRAPKPPSPRSARSGPPRLPGDAVVRDLHLDDVGHVLGLPRDRERLGQAQPNDSGDDLHDASIACALPSARAHRLDSRLPAPVAQGIERAPPERKVAGSIPAGRISTPGAAPKRLESEGHA